MNAKPRSPVGTAARRGDLFVHEIEHRGPTDIHIEYGLAIVTSVTRQGRVTAYRAAGDSVMHRSRPSNIQLVSAACLDVPALEAAYLERGAPYVRGFASVDKVREFVRRHLQRVSPPRGVVQASRAEDRALAQKVWSDRYSTLLSYRRDLTTGTNGDAMRAQDRLLTAKQGEDLQLRYAHVRDEQANAERSYAEAHGQAEAEAVRAAAVAHLASRGFECPSALEQPVPHFHNLAGDSGTPPGCSTSAATRHPKRSAITAVIAAKRTALAAHRRWMRAESIRVVSAMNRLDARTRRANAELERLKLELERAVQQGHRS